MRGLLAASLAASALLLGGCDKFADSVDDNSATQLGDDNQGFGGPISVDDNVIGVAPGNTAGELTVEEAAGNEVVVNESATPDP